MKKNIVYKTEEFEEFKKFALVLIAVIVLIAGIYFLSRVVIKNSAPDLAYQTGSVQTDIAIVGTILNEPEDTYYVLAYDSTSSKALAYLTYAGYYKDNQKDAIKIYYLDLNEGFNKDYYVKENSNPKATKISDLKMLDGTLLKIQKGKITKYLEGTEKIAQELKVTEEKEQLLISNGKKYDTINKVNEVRAK